MSSPYRDPAPRGIHALNIASEGDGWALNLPRDTGAAVAYLRGLERARSIELEAIRALRHRIDGQPRPRLMRRVLRDRRAIVVLLLIASAIVVCWFVCTALPLPPAAATSSMQVTSHEGHATMGSGVAVELAASSVTPTRTFVAPGDTTFILRNSGERASEFLVVPRASIDGSAARMTPQQLHHAAVAARRDIAPGARVELSAQLAAGEYLLVANHADGVTRTAAFSVR